MKSLCFLVALLLLFTTSIPAEPKRLKIDFIDPYSIHHQFWDNLVGSMETAAQQLGIDFTVHVAVTADDMVNVATRLANGPDRPDCLVVTIHKNVHARVLQVADKAHLPIFVVNSGLIDEDLQRYGGPREHLKSWIGQMLPDDAQAGYTLAKILLKQAKAQNAFGKDHRVPVIALNGPPGVYPTEKRAEGLRKAISEDPAANLLQIVPGDWSYDEAKAKIPMMLQRYPQIKVVWAANDFMATGVISGLEQMGRQPGKEILVGGIDWDDTALKAIMDGKMVASLGGHFLDGAWSMVLLCDYFHGIDFATERTSWRSILLPLDKENIDKYVRHFGAGNWRTIDFRRFSKYYNHDLKKYDFSLNFLMSEPATAPKP